MVSVPSLPVMASPAVGVVIHVKCVRCIALDECNLIVPGEFRRESCPLICRPMFSAVDNLTLAASCCDSTVVKTVLIVPVPRIIAGRTEEWRGRPFEDRAIRLKLIARLPWGHAIKRVVMKNRYPATDTAYAKRRSSVKIVVINFSRPAAPPAPIFCAVTLHLRIIHMIVAPHPSAAAKIIRTASWQASQSFR